MREVDKIYSRLGAFAVVLMDETVVTWGDEKYGDDCNKIKAALRGVDRIYSTWRAFAAVLKSGTVVSRGFEKYGGRW